MVQVIFIYSIELPCHYQFRSSPLWHCSMELVCGTSISALIYLSDRSWFPLQLILREILVLNEMSTGEGAQEITGSAGSFADQVKIAAQIKYAVMIVSTLPLIMVYPFIQRFFVQGVLIGSVKE